MKTPIKIGLTGSIGMGKTTVRKMFESEGVPTWDADATVHALYNADGAAVAPIEKILPGAIEHRAVDREKLKRFILNDPGLLADIEKIVHPLVAASRMKFLNESSSDIVVFDIPLLFEAGLDDTVDVIAVVSVPEAEQRRRVLERNGMTEEQFDLIRAKQMPDAEKRRRADYVIDTNTPETALAGVKKIIEEVRAQHA